VAASNWIACKALMKKVPRATAGPNPTRREEGEASAAASPADEPCSSPAPRRLFSVSNHHVSDAGHPPTVEGDAPNTYHGYFENRYGEQSLFVYERESGRCSLWCGDAGWGEPHPVIDGRVPGLVLAPEELAWLRACWTAVTR
jgi:hypothetical protein